MRSLSTVVAVNAVFSAVLATPLSREKRVAVAPPITNVDNLDLIRGLGATTLDAAAIARLEDEPRLIKLKREAPTPAEVSAAAPDLAAAAKPEDAAPEKGASEEQAAKDGAVEKGAPEEEAPAEAAPADEAPEEGAPEVEAASPGEELDQYECESNLIDSVASSGEGEKLSGNKKVILANRVHMCKLECESVLECESFGFGKVEKGSKNDRCIIFDVPAAEAKKEHKDLDIVDRSKCGGQDIPLFEIMRDYGTPAQGGEEAKPEGEEAKPEGEEAKPEGEEAKPKGEEAKPEGEEAKPEGEAAKPEGEEAKTEAAPEVAAGGDGKDEGKKEGEDKEGGK